ncbi:MAG: oxygen-independent coproporphyrinogen III oxidase [Alphaproteobacteria bacterium]
MDPALLARFEIRRVPRYTSYPTAPHFTAAVDADMYEQWLGQITPDQDVSLYLHVPYCRTLCLYCGCHTRATARQKPVDAYAAALLREVAMLTARLPRRMRLAQVHWGGGTPTILAPRDLLGVMDVLRAHFRFDAETEVAIEADPRRLPDETLAALGRGGFNRASIGVQSFDPAVQAAIGRIQSFEETARAAAALRRHGARGISVDLIYGLPHETVASATETADRVVALAPDRVAVFGYAHVPWMKRHQRLIDETTLPDGPARLAQFAVIAGRLLSAGYRRVGLDHFARPGDRLARAADDGTLHRNFQGYTTDAAPVLIGLGASAIGSLPAGYVQNLAAVPDYLKAIGEGRLPVARGRALTPDDRLRRDVIEQLMCHGRVDLTCTAQRHWTTPAALGDAQPALERLVREGVAQVDGPVVRVADEARPLVRCVAAAFDAYLADPDAATGTARHARAV